MPGLIRQYFYALTHLRQAPMVMRRPKGRVLVSERPWNGPYHRMTSDGYTDEQGNFSDGMLTWGVVRLRSHALKAKGGTHLAWNGDANVFIVTTDEESALVAACCADPHKHGFVCLGVEEVARV